MAGISVSGLASGLDVESIISGLMQVESAPRARLELRQGQARAREAALREIETKLRAVADAAAALASPSLWADVQSVESSAPGSVAARLTGGAGPGGYGVEVTQLARAEQRTYDFTPSASASQLTINGTDVSLAAGATLADAVAAINANAGAGVFAVAVAGQLVLSSRETGAENTIAAGGATIAEDAAKAKAGRDAIYSVDGVVGASASNVVADAIPGVELTLKAVTVGAASITVGNPAPDAAAVKSKVEAFVNSYNAAVDAIRARLSEERVPGARTQADANKGVLFGDSQLNGLLTRMRRLVDDAGLEELGVGTGPPNAGVTSKSSSVAGRLVFEEAKLAAALQADGAGVRELLAGPGGFAAGLDELLDPVLDSGGAIPSRLSAAGAELRRLGESMEALELRLESREARLRAQFAALEEALMRSQSESQWLSGQLAALG